jgi:hypothetical protein
MLGHANNAMYMQWAMDAVDYDIASTMPVREFTINFNHETKPGDVVSIYKARIIEDDAEKWKIMEIITKKYAPNAMQKDVDAKIDVRFKATAIIVMEVEHLSGKESMDLVKMR